MEEWVLIQSLITVPHTALSTVVSRFFTKPPPVLGKSSPSAQGLSPLGCLCDLSPLGCLCPSFSVGHLKNSHFLKGSCHLLWFAEFPLTDLI